MKQDFWDAILIMTSLYCLVRGIVLCDDFYGQTMLMIGGFGIGNAIIRIVNRIKPVDDEPQGDNHV